MARSYLLRKHKRASQPAHAVGCLHAGCLTDVIMWRREGPEHCPCLLLFAALQ